jgi:hypothetical protein
MKRLLFAMTVLMAVSLDSVADELKVDFHVQPMAAPVPALKYQLLPQIEELNPGNAAQNYLKCFMEQHAFFFSKQAVLDRDRYQSMPLIDLARERMDGYGSSALRQADWAARMESLDWQSLSSIQSSGIEGPPGEVGPIQVLAKALHVRFRGEIARRDFDNAIRTAKTMLALSRHLGEHPTEVANLVGLWVAHLSLNAIGEMVQQAKCPNLYWALTNLPSPLVDLRKGIQGERTMVATELRAIKDDAPMTDSEIETFVGRLSGVISVARQQAGQPPRSVRAALNAAVKDAESLKAARQRLIEGGLAAKKVEQFPAAQVVLLEQKHRYVIERDDRLKLLAVPIWQIAAKSKAPARIGTSLSPLRDLLPNIEKVRAEEAELERQLALLRYIEAIRLYAAEHDGKAPASVADLAVPLPLDPLTGKPFVYSAAGTVAHIRGDSPVQAAQLGGQAVEYSVTIHK